MGGFTEGAKAVGKFLVQDVVGRPLGAVLGGVSGAAAAPFIGLYKDTKNIIQSDNNWLTKLLGLVGVVATAPLQLIKSLDGLIEGVGSGLADGFEEGATTPLRMGAQDDGGQGLLGSVGGAALGGTLGAATGGIITAWKWINSDNVGWTTTGPNGQPVINFWGILFAGVAGLVVGTIVGIGRGLADGWDGGISGALKSPEDYAKYGGLEPAPVKTSNVLNTQKDIEMEEFVSKKSDELEQKQAISQQSKRDNKLSSFPRPPAQTPQSYHDEIAARHRRPLPPDNAQAPHNPQAHPVRARAHR